MWWRFLVCLVAVGGVFLGTFAALKGAYAAGDKAGWERRNGVALGADLGRSEAARTLEAQARAAGAQADAQHAEAAERIRVVYRTIREEVPANVTPAIDARYPLPVGLVRLHDAAVLGVPAGSLPDPAGRPDDAASDVTASHAAGIFADNGEACRANAQQLSDLQALIRTQPGYPIR